jgi:Tol biopolymer transport system component
LLTTPAFDLHASFSFDGAQIVFTSERRGRGQSDLYLAGSDGTGIRPLIVSEAVDDVGVLSPNGRRLAFVSTRGTGRANIWTLELATGRLANLTGRRGLQGAADRPNGFFRPAWSPDGQWLAFSSDRNTPWKGHACAEAGTSCTGQGEGWEHVQELSLYIVRADGSGFRQLMSRPGYSMGSPKWSLDGRRLVFHEMSIENTWNARIAFRVALAESQIASVDVVTGERVQHTTGAGLKLSPQYVNNSEIGYLVKNGANQGLHYTSSRPSVSVAARSPTWSPDGKQVLYQKLATGELPQNSLLYSWDQAVEYRSTDSFPRQAQDGTLVLTEQSLNSSIAIMNADGSGRRRVFDTEGKGLAFAPCWSADSQWIVFGFGLYFEARIMSAAKILRVRRDGTGLETLYEGKDNAGFPSCSPDGRSVVFRVTSRQSDFGLRILDLSTRAVSVLTREYDNMPDWSPDGSSILFTRRLSDGNFDIFTIRTDGSRLRRLTTSGTNDAHAVWTRDGRILWNTGVTGFRDEAPLYDASFQPYGQIWIMNADGNGARALTDSLWEDSQPLYIT